MLQIIGEVDDGHAATAELALDAVAALEGSVQAGDGVRHCSMLTLRVACSLRQTPRWESLLWF